jgi:SAM-dependent methyltransferase
VTDYTDILEHGYWLHRIDLGEGKYTPGSKDASYWSALGLPDTLEGKSLLDVGTFDGLVAFEAERRGAEHVLATDVWHDPPADDRPNNLQQGRRGFDLVQDYLDTDVEGRRIGANAIDPDTVGTFDVVVVSGVLVYLEEPLAALRALRSVASETLVVESLATRRFADDPLLMFDRPSRTDRALWWVPNVAGLSELVKAAGCGLEVVESRPVDESTASVPSVSTATVAERTSVYRTPELSETVVDLDADTPVMCLHTTSGRERVEFRHPAPVDQTSGRYYQGWVPERALDRSATPSALHSDATVEASPDPLSVRARRTLRRDGLGELVTVGVDFLRTSLGDQTGSTHLVVHGTPESGGDR